MAITSELIGKFGGAEVEEATVEGRVINRYDTVIHTVEVPPGKSLLVGFVCRFSKIYDSAFYYPKLQLGGSIAVASETGTDIGISAVITETSDITISANANERSSTLSGGTVYTAEM